MKHLLGIEGMNREDLLHYVGNARALLEISGREVKKVPALRGKTVVNLFFESSTRTRTSFEIAGKWLSADVINISSSSSSVTKGETLLDTARTLEAMSPDVLVVRHSESGAPCFLSRHLSRTRVVNAGDGAHEHPTQALVDVLAIEQRLAAQGRDLSGLVVAIVGDLRHSRVARSHIWAQLALGSEVRLVGPPTLVPPEFGGEKCFGGRIKILHDIGAGLRGADIVLCLRLQLEREAEFFIPSIEEYSREFGINERRLREFAPQAIVLHPGPVNRGIEVSSEVIDRPRSLVNRQVEYGVAVRMAVLLQLGTEGRYQEAA